MILFNIAAYGLIAIGIIHFMFAVKMFNSLDTDFLWFISASMGLIYSGVLNIIFRRSHDTSKKSIILVQLCNALNIIFSGLAIYILQEPQPIIIFIFSAVLFGIWIFKK